MFVARAIDRMAGGVERMVITIMNEMVARGHTVELFTWDYSAAIAFYPMAPQIKWHRLNMGDPRMTASPLSRLRRAHAIRALVQRSAPDVIICFQDGPFTALRGYTVGMGIPVIAAERNAPTRFEFTNAARWLTYNFFRFAARIVLQFQSYTPHYPEYLHKKITIIPNPVFPAEHRSQPHLAIEGRYRILSVGRLSYQKNYPTLIEAFAAVAPDFPEWDLTLLGEGEERAKLESLIAEKSLIGRIIMPGTSSLIANFYAGSHLFCLPSLWEGFPNALAEALAHGLPCVGFAECAGVRDLIRRGENGLLARGNGDVDTLANALRTLMSSAEMRRGMGLKAIVSVQHYAPRQVYALWERTLMETLRYEMIVPQNA